METDPQALSPSAQQPGSFSHLPLGPGLGKLKRGKSGSDSSYLVSKRDEEANCPNCQGLFPRGPPGWGQTDRWDPCDVLRSDRYGGRPVWTACINAFSCWVCTRQNLPFFSKGAVKPHILSATFDEYKHQYHVDCSKNYVFNC